MLKVIQCHKNRSNLSLSQNLILSICCWVWRFHGMRYVFLAIFSLELVCCYIFVIFLSSLKPWALNLSLSLPPTLVLLVRFNQVCFLLFLLKISYCNILSYLIWVWQPLLKISFEFDQFLYFLLPFILVVMLVG